MYIAGLLVRAAHDGFISVLVPSGQADIADPAAAGVFGVSKSCHIIRRAQWQNGGALLQIAKRYVKCRRCQNARTHTDLCWYSHACVCLRRAPVVHSLHEASSASGAVAITARILERLTPVRAKIVAGDKTVLDTNRTNLDSEMIYPEFSELLLRFADQAVIVTDSRFHEVRVLRAQSASDCDECNACPTLRPKTVCARLSVSCTVCPRVDSFLPAGSEKVPGVLVPGFYSEPHR